MAYITGEELKTRLPLDGGDLEASDLQPYIDDHIARATADNPTESAYSRLAVARAAHADGLAELMGQAGRLVDDTRTIETLRKEAEAFFDKHAALAPASVADGYATLSNLSDTPLWNG